MHPSSRSADPPTVLFQPLIRLSVIAVLLIWFLAPVVSAQTITVSSKVVGKTPRVIGLNCGNFKPGSNTTTWWKWIGVNGARIFTSANRVESKDDIEPHGDGVTDKESFLARRKSLRADPTNPQHINFDAFERGYAKTSGHIDYAFALSELSANGIHPLIMTARTNDHYPIDDWAGRWEHWQHYYAQAYHLGKKYDVERYSIYNEPDHESRSITQPDFLLRLQLASDAIQSAIDDVNRDANKRLKAQILAPITAGSAKDYGARLKNSDTRDDKIGWGELVIKNIHTNFLGKSKRGFQLIHTYAYQQYNADGKGYAEDLTSLKQLVAADLGAIRSSAKIDFGLTEFNVHSNGVFQQRQDSLDSPSRYARLGEILAGLTSQMPQELYLFKFSSNANEKELQKNAILHNSRFDAPYNIGGASRSAGVFKLFTKGFCGSLDQHVLPDGQGNGVYAISSYNKDNRRFCLLVVNASEKSRELNVDLSGWGVRPGAVAQVEEVSEGHLAEVTLLQVVSRNRQIRFQQPKQSVILVSVTKTAAQKKLALTATDDAVVTAGDQASKNDGRGKTLTVKNSARRAEDRSVSYLKFDMSEIGSLSVDRAVLKLHVDQPGNNGGAIAHVYGLDDDDWGESKITWENSANLKEAAGDARKISDNFVDGINETAHFVGHLTANKKSSSVFLDVTDFVRNHNDKKVTFLLAREVRIDGEKVDGEMAFASKEDSKRGPTLLLELNKRR